MTPKDETSMKMLRYRRPLRLLPLHRHQFRLVVDLSLFLRAGPFSKPVSTGGEPQDESPRGFKRVGDEDALAPSTPDAPGSDEADSEDKPTKEQKRLARTGNGERRAAWTKHYITWNHRLLPLHNFGTLHAALRLKWLLPTFGHQVAAKLTYCSQEGRSRMLL